VIDDAGLSDPSPKTRTIIILHFLCLVLCDPLWAYADGTRCAGLRVMPRKGDVRSHASEYHLDPRRIGVLGVSAGGHLAAQTAEHFDAGSPAAQGTIERASSPPDFAILSYPVIGPLAES
jgi:hypothetical protein